MSYLYVQSAFVNKSVIRVPSGTLVRLMALSYSSSKETGAEIGSPLKREGEKPYRARKGKET